MRRTAGLAALAAVWLGVPGCGGGAGADPVTPPPASATPAATGGLFLAGVNSTQGPLSELGLDPEPLPEDAELTGPYLALKLDSVAVTGGLSAEQVDELLLAGAGGSPLSAPPGRELLVVQAGEADHSGVQAGPELSVEVRVGGETRPLAGEHTAFVNGVLPEFTVFVVDVPVGEDATLTIGDGERTSAISLRTGGRPAAGDSPVDGLAAGSASFEDGIRLAGITPADTLEAVRATLHVTPAATLADAGEPGDGQVWLELDLTISLIQCEWCAVTNGDLALDLAGSLALRTDDGTELELPEESPQASTVDPTLAVVEWSGAVAAPASIRSVEVTYATVGSFTADGGGAVAIERPGPPVTETVDLATG